MDDKKEITNFLEESLLLFRKWREVDLIMDKRSGQDKDQYQAATYNDAMKILFALYRSIDAGGKDITRDIDSARLHLNSLVYESFSILQTSLLTEIYAFVNQYSLETINTIVPQYFEKYAQRAEVIKNNINKLDNKRKTLSLYEEKQDPQTSLDEMYADVIFLNDVLIHFKTLEPQFNKKVAEDNKKLEEAQEKDKATFKLQTISGLLIGILGAVVGSIVTIILTPILTPSSQTQQPSKSQSTKPQPPQRVIKPDSQVHKISKP